MKQARTNFLRLTLWKAGLIAIPSLLVVSSAQPQTEKPTSEPPGLCFKGAYESSRNLEVLRFFEDGTVVKARVKDGERGDFEDAIVGLSKDSATKGLYIVSGAEIEFSIVTPEDTVDYKGTIGLESITLERNEKAMQRKFSDQYKFIAVPKGYFKDETRTDWSLNSFIRYNHSGRYVKVLLGTGSSAVIPQGK